MKKLLLFILLPLFVHSQGVINRKLKKALNQLDSNQIKAHVAYLADDKLKGRMPGQEGYQLAVDYVINQFKTIGLPPAGEENGYTQKVILRKSILQKEGLALRMNLKTGETKTLDYGTEFLIFPHPEKTSVEISAPMVFVGAGFDRPEMGFKDYENIDVKGKIVVVMKKVPDSLAANVKLHLNYAATTQEYAIKNGAIGILTCNYATSAVQFKAQSSTLISAGQTASMDNQGKVVGSISHRGLPLQIAGAISVKMLSDLLKAEGLDFEKIGQRMERGENVSTPLTSTLQSSYTTQHQDFTSYNIIGKIEGSDAELKNEYVVHTAHLDHLGIGKAVNGDSIYNGAHDNASGVACSLEMARIYANLKEKPKRSVLFVIVTAEEMGLLGSAYFAAHPTVPKGTMVANVNTDMPTIIAPLESISALGAEHSSLSTVVAQAAKALKLGVEPDLEPKEGRFVRSDQYSFVRAGIPALHVKYGSKTSLPNFNLLESVKKWREATYHKTADNFNGGMFYWSAGRKYAQLNFLIGYLIAQNPARPAWKKGDFFEVK
ncbi:M20/M25/M40 family metallo-hydrolase [Runella salmonicolor]|uniref:M20/M25/M40 family metallo-hydrolase n=1 Tax=Runella salmonicolor TaxID=2950278 RepID=A0ABT1FLT6_9BACT|nr:M20/M25/M40 family metallo-hydrolase [Runella salmonicolor]MCP1381482.1 M20/M25/M40 family metallo-hydrolase [Runella salmonicolor]